MRETTTCPRCGAPIERAEARAPGSLHVAVYYTCGACPFWAVERTPEHEAELAGKERRR